MNNSRKQVINLLSDSENDDEGDDFQPKSKAKPNADNSNTIVNSLLARLQSKSTLRIGKSHQSLKESSDKMTRSKDVFKAIKIEQSRAGGINCSSSTSSSSSSSTIIKNETNPINEKILKVKAVDPPLPVLKASKVLVQIYLFGLAVFEDSALHINDKIANFLAAEGRLLTNVEFSSDDCYWVSKVKEIYKASVQENEGDKQGDDVIFDMWSFSKPIAKMSKTELGRSGHRFTRMLNPNNSYQARTTDDYPPKSISEVIQKIDDAIFIVLSERPAKQLIVVKKEEEKPQQEDSAAIHQDDDNTFTLDDHEDRENNFPLTGGFV